ncbi:MAG: cytochrome c, partial [Chloroflexi bacterium]|nr:cytochrome c [Chloroflexota bacterium]
MKRALALPVLLAASLVVACTAPPASSTPTAEPHEEESVGLHLFREKGCAVCHGQNAQGSAIAPALPGHTADQVRRQVRSPRFQMPAFGPAQVSDEELDVIVAYIESLGPAMAGMEHMEPVA